MSDLRRLIESEKSDSATRLLRSARADQAPSGAKDRARARLGLLVQDSDRMVLPKKPAELSRLHLRTKRAVALDKPVLFQSVISSGGSLRNGKLGAMVVAMVQVAVLVTALFVRPMPHFQSAPPVLEVHQDEPEVIFILPEQNRSSGSSVKDTVAIIDEKKPAVRREWFGGTNRPVIAPPHAARLPMESVVGEEQASALTEHEVITNPSAEAPSANVAAARNSMPQPGTPMPFDSAMKRPVRVHGREPAYTQAALLARVQGMVVMKCVITELGLAKDCVILKSLPHLDDAVLSAARTWRFSPAMLNGRPVAAQYVFPFHFKRQ